MTYIKPSFHHPLLPVNKEGYTKKDYEGVISTLCSGCGHDSISAAIVQACFEMNIQPHRVAKLSGIGCSSKTPNYFLNHSHGFNSVHGRMPSVATGAILSNRDLMYLGVSGDGDTASIGMGQFVHAVRRNLNITYIVMNNGCYGLTKGQDSATADEGSVSKSGVANQFQAIDLAGLALEIGATFVGRSFSGDKAQLIPLIKAAMSHNGFALIDVISPCVTFNNNPGSTKSYDYIRQHVEAVDMFDYVPEASEIKAEYGEGEELEVEMHDGSKILLHKLARDWDPFDRFSAQDKLNDSRYKKGEILTGLIYIDEKSPDLHELINTVDVPLNTLKEEDLCPGNEALQAINKSLR